MSGEQHWNRFAATGRVEDYLNYCRNSVGHDRFSDASESEAYGRKEQEHERNRDSDRDDTCIVSHKGI